MGSKPATPSSGLPNPEKRRCVTQNKKDATRFDRVQEFIQPNPEIGARLEEESLTEG